MMRIHHIGYLVKNMQKAEAGFVSLGFRKIEDSCHDTYRKVDIIFMEKDGYVIELVSPYEKDSIVSNLMKTHRNSPYHICYEVENIEEAIIELEEQGYCIINGLLPAPAIKDKRVCFLLSAKVGMVELVEKG